MAEQKNKKQERLFLIDGYALAYRAYFAFIKRPLINSKGRNTSAVFGFLNTLLSILRTESPDHIAVVLDSREPTFRHKRYKEYKATREKMPEDLVSQLAVLREIIQAFSIPVLELPGYEADDIMGTLASMAGKEKVATFLVTGDKDFMQLVSDSVKMYKPGKANGDPEIIDADRVREKFGVDPHQVIDVLALMGDSSDNIPGVPGIGEKTAKPLIREFGTLERLLEKSTSVKQRGVREKLIRHRESALLSKELVTIDTNVPLSVSFHDLNIKKWNREELIRLLKELEFESILRQIDTEGDAAGEINKTSESISTGEVSYRNVDTAEDFAEMLSVLREAKTFSFDTETTSRDPLSSDLIGISFSTSAGSGWFIPFEEHNIPEEQLTGGLRELFKTPNPKGGQNIKFDMLALRSLEIYVQPPLFDTMIASYIIRPDRQHKLDSLAREYLGYTMVTYSDLVGTGKNQLSIRDVNREELIRYSCEDADITLQLWHKMKPELEAMNALHLCETIEFPLIRVLYEMEATGVAIDVRFLHRLSKSMSEDLGRLRGSIYAEAGFEFNINSTRQLGNVLFNTLKLPPVKKTKTGYSTDTFVLERLNGMHPVIEMLLEYRQLTKLQSTYVDALPKLIRPRTQRVHTSFNQTITQTGRLSSSNPNLQNIPIRTDIGRSIRKAFVASSGEHSIMSSDYSQIELRIMAHISGDEGLRGAFHNKEDIHATTAAKVFDVPLHKVTPNMRRKAKEVNFGIMYGISAYGLASRLEVPQNEAALIIERYFNRFPKVHEYIQNTISTARKDGFVTTLMGRRRYLPDVRSRNKTVQQNAERQAINMPIQGTAADMIKLAMVRIHEKLQLEKLRSRMIIQVHDELVFDVHNDELEPVRTLVENEMINALELSVPVEVETGTGTNWYEAH